MQIVQPEHLYFFVCNVHWTSSQGIAVTENHLKCYNLKLWTIFIAMDFDDVTVFLSNFKFNIILTSIMIADEIIFLELCRVLYVPLKCIFQFFELSLK